MHQEWVSGKINRRRPKPALTLVLALTLILVALVGQARAAVIRVPADYPKIQAAVDAAQNGDEIIVSPGTYKEKVWIINKNLNLHSTNPYDWAVVDATIIDASNYDSPVNYFGAVDETGRLAGFKLTNGGFADSDGTETGSGINGNKCKALIEYNHICNNHSSNPFVIFTGDYKPWHGGGLRQCFGIVQNNIIENNSADEGGGLWGCRGLIRNNLIRGNWSTALSYSDPKLGDHPLSNGAGGAMHSCRGSIVNNTIVDNYLADLGGPAGGLMECTGSISNNIIWNRKGDSAVEFSGNATPRYCCIKGWTKGGTGNLATDPGFADPDHGNFDLKQDSPCVDAGQTTTSVTTDLKGRRRGIGWIKARRGDGSHMDMGALEFTPKPLTMWIPSTTSPIFTAGKTVQVSWVVQPAAGASLWLRLLLAGQTTADLGNYSLSGTHTFYDDPGLLQVRVPWNLAGSSRYAIRAVSNADRSMWSDTGLFTIQAIKNAADPQAWPLY